LFQKFVHNNFTTRTY